MHKLIGVKYMGELLAILYNGEMSRRNDYMNELNKSEQLASCSKVFPYENIVIGVSEKHMEPLSFKEGRYTIVLNGRIYNGPELKKDLKQLGYRFETDYSNEVIANLFLEKGVQSFKELRGMFTILIWDHLKKIMYGARDSFGIKHLYYTEREEEALFGTSKESLLLSNDENQMNLDALQQYMTYQYIPESMTMRKDVFKIEPGSYFIKKMNQPIQVHRYFHITFNPMITEKCYMMGQIREALYNSVEKHIKKEKSLGSFLSGGIDSSLIAMIAKDYVPDLKTFTVGFDYDGYSEIEEAKQTAEFLGVENVSYVITPQEFIDNLPEIIMHLDDPFADPSSIPLYFAIREAKRHVNTILSGEGADELFGGYNIYREYKSLALFKFMPLFMKKALYKLSKIFPEGMRGKNFLERGTTPLEERYVGNAKIFDENEKKNVLKLYNNEISYQSITNDLYKHVIDEHPVHQMQYIDLHTWLPGNILYKAHKMSKAHSLELRLPFLDKEVYKIARSIPVKSKIAKGTTKYILREAFRGYMPDVILNRRKLGFPVPIVQWLKNDLYDWARELIEVSKTDEFINKNHVLYLLEGHAKNKNNHGRKVWTVLQFMMWHQVHIEQQKSLDNVQLHM